MTICPPWSRNRPLLNLYTYRVSQSVSQVKSQQFRTLRWFSGILSREKKMSRDFTSGKFSSTENVVTTCSRREDNISSMFSFLYVLKTSWTRPSILCPKIQDIITDVIRTSWGRWANNTFARRFPYVRLLTGFFGLWYKFFHDVFQTLCGRIKIWDVYKTSLKRQSFGTSKLHNVRRTSSTHQQVTLTC